MTVGKLGFANPLPLASGLQIRKSGGYHDNKKHPLAFVPGNHPVRGETFVATKAPKPTSTP